ncbi:hypothetical protein DIY08_05655 [Shewanella xiamenensis]|nr:hypothetical protein CEQ32_03015 [Shewanella sp. FDAARGOS_354]ODR87468.1 hypothetical protein ABT47_20515 [Shewanella xiamenensis]PWH03828.1 hypothetical protein DIY08_05655 [Shewanella xiamenensis]
MSLVHDSLLNLRLFSCVVRAGLLVIRLASEIHQPNIIKHKMHDAKIPQIFNPKAQLNALSNRAFTRGRILSRLVAWGYL